MSSLTRAYSQNKKNSIFESHPQKIRYFVITENVSMSNPRLVNLEGVSSKNRKATKLFLFCGYNHEK